MLGSNHPPCQEISSRCNVNASFLQLSPMPLILSSVGYKRNRIRNASWMENVLQILVGRWGCHLCGSGMQLCPHVPLAQGIVWALTPNPAKASWCSENNRMERKGKNGEITQKKGEWILLYKAFDQILYPRFYPGVLHVSSKILKSDIKH